jgi:cytochrome P450
VISSRRVAGLVTVPGAVPLLGHAIRFFRDPLVFLRSAHDSGDVVVVRLGQTRAYLVCAPSLVQQVLLRPRVFDKGGSVYEAFRATFGAGVGACSFEAHRRKRRLVQRAFHRSRIAGHAAMISDQVAVLTAGWQARQVVDLNTVMHRLTTTVALRLLFASRASADVVAEVHDRLPGLMRGLYRRAMIPLAPLHALPTPENRRYLDSRRQLHELVGELVLASVGSSKSTEDGGMVSALCAAGLSGQDLHDEVVSLLVGGVQTTVATLCWTFALLSQNHEMRRRLHEEVDTVLAGRPADYDDVWRLEHTRRVVAEVLRLYPPLWVLTREATEDTELAGHPVPAGSTVMFSPYVLHRNPTLFPEPDEFDPDRWHPDRAASMPQGAWIPFGAGNRKCVGDNFATVQATITVAMIANRWRLFSTGAHPTPIPRGELGTGPLPMILQPRP